MIKSILIFLSFFIFSACQSLNSNRNISSISNIKNKMQSKFIEFNGKTNHYLNINNNSKTAVLIVPGATEPAEKYLPLLQDLDSLNHNFYVWDHLSHGRSDYVDTSTPTDIVYVNDFSDLNDPLLNFIEVVLNKYDGQVHVIAHSMGSLAALNSLHNKSHFLHKVFLLSPMIELKTASLSLATSTTDLLRKKGWVRGDKDADITESKSIQSESFRDFYKDLLSNEPKIRRNGLSYGFLEASLKESKELSKKDWSQVSNYVKIFAAHDDLHMNNEVAKDFCTKTLTNCIFATVPNSPHEILSSNDESRETVVNIIKSTIENDEN